MQQPLIEVLDAGSAIDRGVEPKPRQGSVDLLGYHAAAGGWFFSGWMQRAEELEEGLTRVTAHFSANSIAGNILPLFYPRGDVIERSLGFLIFLAADRPVAGSFDHLTIDINSGPRDIYPATFAEQCVSVRLEERLRVIVSLSADTPRRQQMELLINGAAEKGKNGFVEFFGCFPFCGYFSATNAWLIGGWVNRPWLPGDPPETVLLSFDNGELAGKVLAATFYPRGELPDGAQGVLLFIEAESCSLGRLLNISLVAGDIHTMPVLVAAPQLAEAELSARVKSSLAGEPLDQAGDRLFHLLTRQPYTGEDTLDTLSPNIFLFIDEAIKCGEDDLVLVGWMLAKPGEIRQMRLCSGMRSTKLDMAEAIWSDRYDVLKEFHKYGFDDLVCGFALFLPQALAADGKLWIEIEPQRGKVAFRNIQLTNRTGITAIKQLLSLVDVRFDQMRTAFERVLGPAVAALNTSRLEEPLIPRIVAYGTRPLHPKFSVIVPLHGRIDFVEYQLALFSARGDYKDVEFIYVLDDPPRRREAQLLFASIYERFLIPFRAVLLDRNVGFAPANNAGLKYAHGEFVAYLNSDVFPGTQDWLEPLSQRLIADPKLGAVGPLLLFDDGTLQHRGIYFERLAEFGGSYFCQHRDKGRRYTGGGDLQKCLSITGACMVMRRDLALQAGGFDEMYILGDFEDTDLCLKLISLGYDVAVDPQVTLYHLERKSQSSAALNWRSSLTAYNAWRHEQRWATFITQRQDSLKNLDDL